MNPRSILQELPCKEGELFRRLRPVGYSVWMPVFQKLLADGHIWYRGGKIFGVSHLPLPGSGIAPSVSSIIESIYTIDLPGLSQPNSPSEAPFEPNSLARPEETKELRVEEKSRTVARSTNWREKRNAWQRQYYENNKDNAVWKKHYRERKRITNKTAHARALKVPLEIRQHLHSLLECDKCELWKKTDGSDGLEGFSPDKCRYTGWRTTCRQCRRIKR